MRLVQYAFQVAKTYYIDPNEKPWTIQDDSWKDVHDVIGKLWYGMDTWSVLIYY